MSVPVSPAIGRFGTSRRTSSAELNALATTTTVDVIKRDWTEVGQVRATQWATIAYGLGAMAFAGVASSFGNLIQAVNILGSLFYGTILGIFLVAFFLKKVGGTAVFIAALFSQVVILVRELAVAGVAGVDWADAARLVPARASVVRETNSRRENRGRRASGRPETSRR